MRIRRNKLLLAVLFALCIPLMIHARSATAEGVSYEISAFQVAQAEKSLICTISGTPQPVYTVSERFSPFRVVVDIAGATFASSFNKESLNIPKNDIASLSVSEEKSQQPQLMRFEFTLADTHDYAVERDANNIVIKLFPAKATASEQKPQAAVTTGIALRDFAVNSSANATSVTIVADGAIENYTVDTIPGDAERQSRMYVDIPNVTVNELEREKKIGTSVAQVRVANRGDGVRIVFDSALPTLFKYTVAPSAQGLSVIIDETASGADAITNKIKSAPEASKTLDELIDSSEKLLSQNPEKMKSPTETKATALAEEFSFSGYNKQRISVDFYKIDIHNVFRLFRQITDLNIIIDEDVKGSLTLALNDVPWDFALDIVLNLMDLKKEERFNTIVIYPAKKQFVWPTRIEDNLSFKADLEVLQEEALVIEKSASQSDEITSAKELIVQAQQFERSQDFENAAIKYNRAFELWPDNGAIPDRLATLYLVNLGMNAKAVFYAQKSLQLDPANLNAALYAAIGSANMQRVTEAKEYFTQSISGNPPMREALLSFAAFSENNGQNDAALKLIDKYHSYYGESLDTMISKARILDKMELQDEATNQYKAVLSSGFQIRSDLKQFLESRVNGAAQKF